jgi:hypothetical protein
MRRVITYPLFVMQVLMLFGAFVAAALAAPRVYGFTFLLIEQGLSRVGTPTLVALFALLLADTYSTRAQKLPGIT